ncbi:F-box protein [Cardamine amara subsp. amara]|uniref:F-box protein n=1 Tax=Cardamine amara subsp. amara TaxID=228776 RepID=A0ABD1A7A0_CARAN
MAVVKLPWDLEEEILSRLPPRPLVQLRSVCKHWNALFNDKSFLNNHLARARPQFIFLTESKIYSIDINLGGTLEVRELPYDFPCQAMDLMHTTITSCDGFLFRDFWKQGVAVWNPWLRQVGWIDYEDKGFHFCGVGYDSPDKDYKILGYLDCLRRVSDTYHWPTMEPLSLNGNLYWVVHDLETHECFIRCFDFSSEIFKPFCLLPCQKNHSRDELVLAVFKGDRFSLLKQCYVTGKIEIWVTNKKIDGEEVVWINFMTLPTSNLPKLVNKFCGISYFIFDKTLIMCCGDGQTGAPCIYIVREDMFKKIQIESRIVRFSHCVYLPNLVAVPLKFRSLQV